MICFTEIYHFHVTNVRLEETRWPNQWHLRG